MKVFALHGKGLGRGQSPRNSPRGGLPSPSATRAGGATTSMARHGCRIFFFETEERFSTVRAHLSFIVVVVISGQNKMCFSTMGSKPIGDRCGQSKISRRVAGS